MEALRRPVVLFAALIIGQVLLVSAQVQSKSGVRVLELVTFEMFSRVERATAVVVHGGKGVWSNYSELRGARDENIKLRQQLGDLQIQLQEQRSLATRSTKLQALLDLKTSATVPTLAADVIAGNPNPGVRTVTIDRGTADGVVADMGVIAPAGLVGRIIGPVARHAARVQLIVDRNAAAGAMTERGRAGGMILGTDDDPPLRMDLVPNLADVKEGDQVVSSGVDGIYPKGFIVGQVETVEKNGLAYKRIVVRPAVDFHSLEEVLVVLTPPSRDAAGSQE
jgi:rod shape-determining protein MreC